MARFLTSPMYKGFIYSQKRTFVVRANVASNFDTSSWSYEKDVLYQQAAANVLSRRRAQYDSQPDSYVLSFLSSLSKNKEQLQEELILSVTDSRRSNLGKSYQKLDAESPCVQLRNHIADYLTQISQGVQRPWKSSPDFTDKEFSKPLSKDLQQRLSESQLDKTESEVAKRLASYRDGPAPKSSNASPEVQRVVSSLLSDDKLSASFLQNLQQYLETGHHEPPATWSQLYDILGKAQNVLRNLMVERGVEAPHPLTVDQLVGKVFPRDNTEWNFLENWEEQRLHLIDQTFDFPLLEELDLRLAKELYPLIYPAITKLDANVSKRHQVHPQTVSPLQQQSLERLNEVSRALVGEEFNTITAIFDLALIREHVPQWKSLSNLNILHKLRTWRKWVEVKASNYEDEFNETFSKEHRAQLSQRVSGAAPAKRVAAFEQFCQEHSVPETKTHNFLNYFLHHESQQVYNALKEHNINLPVLDANVYSVRRALNLTLSNLNQADLVGALKTNLESVLSQESAKDLRQWAESRAIMVQHETIPSLKEFASLEGTEELKTTLKDGSLPFVKVLLEDEKFIRGISYSYVKKPGYSTYSTAAKKIPREPLIELKPFATKEEFYESASEFTDPFSERTLQEQFEHLEKQIDPTKLE